jgi:uncharacterized protein YkwD
MRCCKGKALSLCILSVLGSAWISMPQGIAEPGKNTSPLSYLDPLSPLKELQQIALDLANSDRVQNGKSPLQPDSLLSQAAQRHAEDMLRRGYFSHHTPEGQSPTDRFAAVGGKGGAAENIAMLYGLPSGDSKLDRNRLSYFELQWMNSPGHRENLLHPDAVHFGYGIAASDGSVYAVQLFSLE